MSIADRISQLNLQHVANKSPASDSRRDTASIEPTQLSQAASPSNVVRRPPPPLPSRQSSSSVVKSNQAPTLPPRQSSLGTRNESRQGIPTNSPKPMTMGFPGPLTFTGIAQTGGATRPTHGNDARVEKIISSAKGDSVNVSNRPPLLPARSSPTATAQSATRPPVPLKPTMPANAQPSTASMSSATIVAQSTLSGKPRKSALDWGFDNKAVAQVASTTQSSSQSPQSHDVPSMVTAFQPFINLATKPRMSATPSIPMQQNTHSGGVVPGESALPLDLSGSDCLQCRDFSTVDNHASRFPRQIVLSLEQLAHDLTAPFGTLTEKARAIFTWLHFNIIYNVEDFFNKSVKPSTPESTLRTGLAVCEGYAALFSNLALHAGLQCVVISGYGNGFGAMAQIQPGQPVPPYAMNHAWNAVKLDDRDGGWHLIDPTWGAGAIMGNERRYTQKLNSSWFTMSTGDFAVKHFPTDQSQWYMIPQSMGGPLRPPTWEEYMRDTSRTNDMEPLSTLSELGVTSSSCFTPRSKLVDLSDALTQGPKMRFEMRRICTHWDKIHSRGQPKRPFILSYGNGTDAQRLPFTPMPRGAGWFAIVDIADVRRRCNIGDLISAFVITTFDGRDPAGVNASEVVNSIGKKAWGGASLTSWTINAM